MNFQPLNRQQIVEAVVHERERQETLFLGNEEVLPTDFMWAGIVTEQTGKALSALNYFRRSPSPDLAVLLAYEQEMIKAAASAIQAVEKIQCLKRETTGQPDRTESDEIHQPSH